MATTTAMGSGIEGTIADTDIMTTGSDKQDMIEIVERDIGREIGKIEIRGVMDRDALGILGMIGITAMMEKDAVEILGMIGMTGMMEKDAVEIMGMEITRTN